MTNGLHTAGDVRIKHLGAIGPGEHTDELQFIISYADGYCEPYVFSYGRARSTDAGIGIFAISASKLAWNDSSTFEEALKKAETERRRLAHAWSLKLH